MVHTNSALLILVPTPGLVVSAPTLALVVSAPTLALVVSAPTPAHNLVSECYAYYRFPSILHQHQAY